MLQSCAVAWKIYRGKELYTGKTEPVGVETFHCELPLAYTGCHGMEKGKQGGLGWHSEGLRLSLKL